MGPAASVLNNSRSRSQSQRSHLDPEYYPDGVTLYKEKGLTYGPDGTTIIDSLFQNIADGIVPPTPAASRSPSLLISPGAITSNSNRKDEENGQSQCSSDGISGEGTGEGTETDTGRQLLHQDEHVAAFYTMDPGCHEGHVLVVPRNRPLHNTAEGNGNKFLKTCADLSPTESDIDLLSHMKTVGHDVMAKHQKSMSMMSEGEGGVKTKTKANSDTNTGTPYGYFFHVPPYNSINHLHLHVLGSKDNRSSIKNYIKYPPFDIETHWCIRLDTILASLKLKKAHQHDASIQTHLPPPIAKQID
jgi:diadenosine tetraphosphate (Ap4A) HIT family hydrolase